jgi:hypothetical protein
MVAFRFTNGDINIIKLSESMVFLLIKCTLVNAMFVVLFIRKKLINGIIR